MDRYTHMHKDNMADGRDAQPHLSAPDRQQPRGTGTDGRTETADNFVSLPVSLNPTNKRINAHDVAQNTRELEHHETIGNTGRNDGFSGIINSENEPRPLGGIGRRDGFKIHFPKGVSVQVR